jgi:hypothetical protein
MRTGIKNGIGGLLGVALALALLGCQPSGSPASEGADSGAGTAASSPTAGPTATPTQMVLAALTLEDLMSAPVPSVCEHPAGTLVDGVLPGIDRMEGIVQLTSKMVMAQDGGPDPASFVAFNPAPTPTALAAVAVLECDRGGVVWPDVLVAYDYDLNVLASYNSSDYSGGPNDDLWSLAWNKDATVTFNWSTHYSGEASCCGSLETAASLVERDGQVSLIQPDVFGVTETAGELFTAMQSGDIAAAEANIADPKLIDNLKLYPTTAIRLTSDWTSSSRATCVPKDYVVGEVISTALFETYNSAFYCTSKFGHGNGTYAWNPGVHFALNDAGEWMVVGHVLYMD